MEKKKRYTWIYWIVLAGLYNGSLYILGYEHLINPNEPPWMVIAFLVLFSIHSIFLFGSIGLILTAIKQKVIDGIINLTLSYFLFYTPRIAGILMILFAALFALDVFISGGNFWRQLIGFLVHAILSIFLGILMFFAWRKPMIGFILFGLGAIGLLPFVIMGGNSSVGNFIMFVAPLALISAMFWINWKWKDAIMLGKEVR
jgi:hypothetical protein